MQRFEAKILGGEALFSDSEAHHLLDVMRAREGDIFEVISLGEVYLARLEKRNPLKVTVIRKLDEDNELPSHLVLGFSLLKGGHDELVLLKGTELGVSAFRPFISSRTIIKLSDEEKKRRLLRFQKIVEEGSKQSKRTLVPTVYPIESYSEVLEAAAERKVIAYENEKEEVGRLDEAIASLKDGENLLSLVGPEGGFSQKEVAEAGSKGFLSVGLGKRILRAETASLYLASVFSYLKERGK